MEGRRQRWENHRSQHKKPPRVAWVPAVPSWEKEFCKEVGSIGWEKLLLNKKYIHLYPKVLEWNDCGGKEAFDNAKTRFWAKKNGFSCDLPLPDPNLYIDEIDSDAEIDLELFQDLDSVSTIIEVEEDHEPVADSVLESYETIIPTGWEDLPLEPTLGWSHSNEAWLGYSSEAWRSGYGCEPCYPEWESGWNNESSWNNNNVTTCNTRAYGSSYNTSRTQPNEEWRNRCTPSSLRRHDARD